MNDPSSPSPIPTLQLGDIEPHAGLLVLPPDGQLLYKLMTIENLLRSVDGAYLHFTRVDQYSDSPIADPHDGQQLPTCGHYGHLRGNIAVSAVARLVL